jgi:hypothetical protein
MKILRFSTLFAALILVSCRYPNEFKNVPANAPHAVLQGTKYPNDGHLFATHVNDQPTSFWRSSDVFRVPVGANTCGAAYSDLGETVGYKTEPFVAAAGREYVMVRKRDPACASPFTARAHRTTANAWVIHDRRDRMIIYEKRLGGTNVVVADAPREGYAFGFSSPDSAIAEYHQKNP